MAIVVLAILVVGGFLLYDRVINKEESTELSTTKGTGAAPFTVQYPAGWQLLSKEELDALPGKPLAVIRQKDGKGFVVVRKEKPFPDNLLAFSRKLTTAFKKKVPDFRRQRVRQAKIRAGKALLYTYIRTKTGTVHTVVLVPAGNHGFALNTISGGGEKKIAQQIGAIISSFDTKRSSRSR